MFGTRARPAKVLTAVACALACVLPATAGAAGTQQAPQGLTWTGCHADIGPNFQCATARVPLDYDRPRGATIALALTRLPATDPGEPDRLAVPQPRRAGRLGRRLRARRRAVPVHRRGARPLRPRRLRPARHHAQHAAALLRQRGAVAAVPAVRVPAHARAGAASGSRADRALDTRVPRARRPDHGPHVDRERGARPGRAARAGRRRASSPTPASPTAPTSASPTPTCSRTGCGRSWSTACSTRSRGRPGAAREGALVPFSTRLRSDAGAQATLNEFFRLCDAGGARCAFSGGAAARFAALARQLRAASPSRSSTTTARARLVDYTILIGITLGAMYDSFELARLRAVPGRRRGRSPDVRAPARGRSGSATDRRPPLPDAPRHPRRRRDRGGVPNFLEGFPGVACSDSTNPRSYAAWSINGALADAQFGYFGRLWTWASSICAEWPGADRDRYTGPWNARHRQPGARGRQPLRPGDALRGRGHGRTACCRARRC